MSKGNMLRPGARAGAACILLLALSGPLTIEPLGEGRTSLGVRMNRVHWFKGAVSRVRFTRRALRPEEFMNRARLALQSER